MGDDKRMGVGSIGWVDLTVPGADATRDFYKAVIGWTHTDVEMGGYQDYCMNEPESGKTNAGICHARGVNANQPPQWMIYITVADLDAAVAKCVELGGSVIGEPRSAGNQGRFCALRDPAGAVFAIYQQTD